MAGFWKDIWKHGMRSKYVKSVMKHGINSEYLSGLKSVLTNIGNKYTGSGLSDAQKESMTAEQNFNAQEAEKARQFEKEMSDTSYQRKVADLQNAGLNPALAVGGAGAPMASGNAASSSAPNPEMMDVLGLLIGASQNARQMNIQKDIAMQNVGLSRRKLAADIEMKSRELSLRERALNFEKEMRGKEFGLRERSTDKVIEEIGARIDKMVAETDNEHKKGMLLDVQKRLNEADADIKEAFAAIAKDTYEAELELLRARSEHEHNAAKLAYEQALATQVERGFKESIYTEEYIRAVVDSAVENSHILKRHSEIANHEEYSSAVNAWKNYIVQCLMRGQKPKDFTMTLSGGRTRTFPAPTEKMLVEMRRGLGLDGPTSQSAAWSESKDYGSFYGSSLGGYSESGSSTTHYSSGWR